MKLKAAIAAALLSGGLMAQQFVNGNFENNTAHGDQINLSNASLNAMLPGVNAFGSYGDVDIITSATYGGSGAQDKSWYIAITGGGTDIVALSLTKPLVQGRKYTMSFYDRQAAGYKAYPIQIGLSKTNAEIGTTIYTSPESPVNNAWTKRSFSFTAPNNGQYITVQMPTGALGDWANLDNFVFGDNLCSDSLVVTPLVTSIEKGDNVTFSVSGSSNYTWYPTPLSAEQNNTSVTYHPRSSMVYTVSAREENCKVITATVSVTVTEPPVEVVKVPEKPVYRYRRDSLNGKKISIKETVHVTANSIKIYVWDKNTVDGDKVSIFLNDELIEKNIWVTKAKKELVLSLQPGSNLIVMDAINLGTIPPNTAAIGVNTMYNPITLVSDLKESGAIEIIYSPVASN